MRIVLVIEGLLFSVLPSRIEMLKTIYNERPIFIIDRPKWIP